MNKAYKYGNLHVLMRKFQVEEAFKLIEKYKVTDYARCSRHVHHDAEQPGSRQGTIYPH